MGWLRETAKAIAYRHLGLGAPRYPYALEPVQIAHMILAIDRARGSGASVCEIGVARGMTSRLIAEHLSKMADPPPFYCIDTFASFAEDDIAHEVSERGKSRAGLAVFRYHDVDIWRRHFRRFPFVHAVQSDVKAFDFSTIAPIQAALVDVDLYRPVLAALRGLAPHMIPGGVIVVDDVEPDQKFDGAEQAFTEFAAEAACHAERIGTKGGLLRF